MSAPLVITISHTLGQAEAARRLKTGLDSVQRDFGQVFRLEAQQWDGDKLNFRISAIGQVASGTIEVLPTEVRLELTLPWLLRKVVDRVLPRIRQQATILLGKPG